jgi:hypothetical protein
MDGASTAADFQEAHQKYVRYHANSVGMFNWSEMIKGPLLSFGEYTSPKVREVINK